MWKQFQISHFSASHRLGTEEWLAGYFVGFSNEKWMKKGAVIWLDITLFETKLQHIHCNQTNLLKFPKCLEPWLAIIQNSKTQEEVGSHHCDTDCKLTTLHTSCCLQSPRQVQGAPQGASTCSRGPQAITGCFGWGHRSPAGICPVGTGALGDRSRDNTWVTWMFQNAGYIVKELLYIFRPLSGCPLAHIKRRFPAMLVPHLCPAVMMAAPGSKDYAFLSCLLSQSHQCHITRKNKLSSVLTPV